MNKEHILNEIKRTAEANGGVPLGRERFCRDTGIKQSDWHGKIWVRWSDAILEAGFAPNQMQEAYDDEVLIERLIALIRELGHFPSITEIRFKAHNDPGFPWHNTFSDRLGSKSQQAAKVLSHCNSRPDYGDVSAICAPIAELHQPKLVTEGLHSDNAASNTKDGFVYMALLKLGREKRYKIGKAVLVERRKDQISIQLPEDLELIHTIRTDDAYGIEAYWHNRFSPKNTKGEWFLLSRQDVDAFKRRKFM